MISQVNFARPWDMSGNSGSVAGGVVLNSNNSANNNNNNNNIDRQNESQRLAQALGLAPLQVPIYI